MSDYDFILNNFPFSYSSVTSWQNCAYGFKLNYIDGVDKVNNFFSDFGNFCHRILQLYFEGKLDYFELADYYKEHYYENVKEPLPAFLANKTDDYYNKGLEFFESFEFDKSNWETIIIEDKLELKFEDHKYVVKPDLVLKHKETGKYILVDFKTANGYKNGKLDKAKMKEYLRQFYLYCDGIYKSKGVEISEIRVWFITNGTVETVKFDHYQSQDNFEWFITGIEKIKDDSEFKYNNKNEFYCNELCGVRLMCRYKPVSKYGEMKEEPK